MIYLSIASDFSKTPGFRYESQSPEISGEKFRIDKLIPSYEEALEKKDKLQVNLDGTVGYLTSFLEEAFGGLQRYNKEKKRNKNILDDIEIISTDEPHWKEDIERYVKREIERSI
jgi:hypothetical protein